MTVVVAVTLIAVGATLLGYLAWQLWGTNWVSHRKQDRIVETLERTWQETSGGSATVSEGDATAVVRIPSFGDDYAVPVLEGVSDTVLAAGYGHFDNSADAGGVGNYAVAAHRITHGEPLRRMPELQPGDEIVIETATQVLTYVLDTGGDDTVVDLSEGWVVDPVPEDPDGVLPLAFQPGQRLITLTTCADLFHTDERMVAFGHLETTTWKH